jgi:hypothetical protein
MVHSGVKYIHPQYLNQEILKPSKKNSDMNTMKRYSIKCQTGKKEYIDILKETEDIYVVRVTRMNEVNDVKTSEESISRNLFNMCLQTGYLYPAESSVA